MKRIIPLILTLMPLYNKVAPRHYHLDRQYP